MTGHLHGLVAKRVKDLVSARPKEQGPRFVQAVSRVVFPGRNAGYLGRKLNHGPLTLGELERVLAELDVEPESFFVEHVYSLRKEVDPVARHYAGRRIPERVEALEGRVSALEANQGGGQKGEKVS